MRNYVIINGVNSLTIQGLAINNLPPITKPMIRTQREEIDGRDGDIVTELGYSAYDKQIEIGLWGNYDINDIIKCFTGEGTIVFSNEEDKYYNFKILDQIDYEKLLKFKTATITLHCQPFKYPLEEAPVETEATTITGTGENITLEDTEEAPMKINLKGNTSQEGTPTPETPQDIHIVSGDNEVVVCGKNRLKTSLEIMKAKNTAGTWNNNVYTYRQVDFTVNDDLSIKINGTATGGRADFFLFGGTTDTGDYVYIPQGTYSVYKTNLSDGTMFLQWREKTAGVKYTTNSNNTAIETMANQNCYFYGIMLGLESGKSMSNFTFYPMLVSGSTLGEYEPYQSQTYPINLPIENLLPNNGITGTYSGITFTKNADNTITLNGTATADTYTNVWYDTTSNLVNDTSQVYTMSIGLSNSNVGLAIFEYINNSWVNKKYLYAESTTYTPSGNQTGQIFRVIVKNGAVLNNVIVKPMLEVGTKANNYVPYGTTPIELCKIGNYQDYFYKDSGRWYLHKEIGKVVFTGASGENWVFQSGSVWKYRIGINNSLLSTSDTQPPMVLSNYYKAGIWNNSANYQMGSLPSISSTLAVRNDDITSLDNWKTWLSTHNTTLYYVLATPTYTEITDSTLISQLEALSKAKSYDEQTNIIQVSNGLPFKLNVSVTFAIPMEINNIGNIYAKPILTIEGTGNIGVVLNDIQILEIDLTNNGKIEIDVTKLEAYNPDNNTLLNRLVTGDYMKLLINEGENTIKLTGNVSSATLTNYTRWI